MKIPITVKLEARVRDNLASLSHGLGGCGGRSLPRWIAEVALPRFARYERKR